VHVKHLADGAYACTFDVGGTTMTTIADYLVLTLPFRMLREVDLAQAGFSPRKMTAINELGFGSIGKIHVQLSSKPWVPLHYAGGAYSDPRSFGVVWDDSVALGPSGAPALMTIYPTGNISDQRLTLPSHAAHGSAPAGDVDWFMSEVENVYPGLRRAYMGRAFEDNWAASPHHRGALA
jgi:monoamine oxidase